MDQEEREETMLREIRRLRSVVRTANRDITRKNDILFQVLQFARNQAKKDFNDWKDVDSWLFSNFDITKVELSEIYEGRNEMVYSDSCVSE